MQALMSITDYMAGNGTADAASLGFCDLTTTTNTTHKLLRCLFKVESLLGTGNPQKRKYTVCMQFTNIKVLMKKNITLYFLCLLYKALFVFKILGQIC